MSSNFKLHTDTKCRVIDLADMRFEFEKARFKAFLRDGTIIQSNFCEYWNKFQNHPQFRFFLIDNADLSNMENFWEACESEMEKDLKTEKYLASVTKFSTFFQKRIYVRLIPPLTIGSEEEKRVFADEVMEIIPIVLRQQKTPIRLDDARLAEYRIICADLPLSGGYATLSVSELYKVLNIFDIDKSLITLIPDPSHEMMRRELLRRGGHIRFFAPDAHIVSDVHQAVNHVFQVLVMGVNWKNDKCVVHQECNQRKKALIMGFFEKLARFPKIWLDCSKQFSFIENVREQCTVTYNTSRQCPDYFIHAQPAETGIPMTNYHNVANHFDLHKYNVFPPATKDWHLPVWMLRVLCKLGWIQQFFDGKDDPKITKIMIDNLYFMVPEKYIAHTREFVNRIVTGVVTVGSNPQIEKPVSKMLAAQMKRNAAIQKKRVMEKMKSLGSKS